MSQVESLRDEIGQLRKMVEAGRRGRPIGGELLVALGGILGFHALTNAGNALLGWPLAFTISPPSAIVAFAVFALAITSGNDRLRLLTSSLVAAVLAAVLAEIAWRFMLSGLADAGVRANPAFRMGIPALLVLTPLALIATALMSLWRLRQHVDALSPANRAMIDIWSGIAGATALILVFCALVGWRMNNWFGFMLMPGLVWALWGVGWWLSGRISGSRWMSGVALASAAIAIWYGASFDLWSSSVIGFFALVMGPGLLLVRDARTTAREA